MEIVQPGGGGNSGLELETDGIQNGSQTLLNLIAGTNINLTDDGLGGVTIDASGGGGGANTALSNLAAVSINTSLISDTDNTDALGSASIGWSDLYLGSGAVINFNNGNVGITHNNAGAFILVNPGDLRITSANVGTNADSVPTISSTSTFTNKRIQPRSSTAASGDITPDLATANIWQRTAQAAAITVNAPTGSPALGEVLVFMILDNGTSRAITWNAAFTTRPMTAALPTATTISKQLLVTCSYNGTTWLCLSSTQT